MESSALRLGLPHCGRPFSLFVVVLWPQICIIRTMSENQKKMEKIVSLAKRRGFIYQGSEIYGGLAGTWDYGPIGVELKNNIKAFWWRRFVSDRSDIFGVDAAILMNAKVWQSSGHVDGFTDPLSACKVCKKRFRTDHLEDGRQCPECKGELSEARQFNMMFETHVGPVQDSSSVSYLRPETAQGIFVNYKNILDSFHPRVPFGIAQIGRAYRNEIAPRDFIFRSREFEQMEIEWFCRESEWEDHFGTWQDAMWQWMIDIGLSKSKLVELEVPEEERAHYSKKTIDFEYEFPFGKSELYGLAYRTDFDLRAHQEGSTVDLSYFDDTAGERFIPHVIEPTFGLDRTILALLCEAYVEEVLPTADGTEETRVVMKFKPELAPVTVAVLPLMRKLNLTEEARKVFDKLKREVFGTVLYDETGSIGKRYRRQDEIGTPFAVTIDFDTLDDRNVTIRDRDSMSQDRVAIQDVASYINKRISR